MKRAVSIVTDTTASLPTGFAQAHGIPVVPQVIVFGEESYFEEREITFPEFVDRLTRATGLPKTQAPPPGEFVRVFEQEARRAKAILCIHPSSEVSGTVRSATAARESAEFEAQIRIIDTRTIAGNLGSIVRAATRWAEEGLDADAIEERVREMAARGVTYFMVDTLEYLRRGGRIGGAAALAGSALRIKPILAFQEGRVAPFEKVRTHRRAVERLIALTARDCPPTSDAYLCVMHSGVEGEATALAETLQERLGLGEIPVLGVGAAITTHGGPGVMGVGFFSRSA